MNKELFMQYMQKQFSPMENHFTYDLVSNVVDFVIGKYDGAKRDEMLLKLIPQITQEDLQQYYKAHGEVVEFKVNNLVFYYYKDSYRKYPGYHDKGYVAYGYNAHGERRAFDFNKDGRFICSWCYGNEPWRNDYFGGAR